MYTYNDIEEVRSFIEGLTYSIKETTEEQVNGGNDIPNTMIFLLKRPNENGGFDYGMGGRQVPTDRLGKIVPTIIKEQGNEILCKCETNFENGRMTIKFEDYVNDTKHEEVFDFNQPTQKTDKTFMDFGGVKFSMN